MNSGNSASDNSVLAPVHVSEYEGPGTDPLEFPKTHVVSYVHAAWLHGVKWQQDKSEELIRELGAVDFRARDALALCEGILAAAKEDWSSTTEGAVYLAADVISRLTGQHSATALVVEAQGGR